MVSTFFNEPLHLPCLPDHSLHCRNSYMAKSNLN